MKPIAATAPKVAQAVVALSKRQGEPEPSEAAGEEGNNRRLTRIRLPDDFRNAGFSDAADLGPVALGGTCSRHNPSGHFLARPGHPTDQTTNKAVRQRETLKHRQRKPQAAQDHHQSFVGGHHYRRHAGNAPIDEIHGRSTAGWHCGRNPKDAKRPM